MDVSDDLVTWLRAQLDEREQLARAAGPGPWRLVAESDRSGRTWTEIVDKTGGELYDTESGALEMAEGNAEHIVANDPARVLAEVEAKRRILGIHEVVGGFEDEDMNDLGRGCSECGWSAEYSDRGGECETVRLLALPYADRPGYRQEWAP